MKQKRKPNDMSVIKTMVVGLENMDIPKRCSKCKPQISLWCCMEKGLDIDWNKRHPKCPIALAKGRRSNEHAD